MWQVVGGIDLTRMECKDERTDSDTIELYGIDLTRMECKEGSVMFLHGEYKGIDLTRMECKGTIPKLLREK